MTAFPFILAAANLESQVQEATGKPVLNTREALLVIGVSLIVGLVLFLWAYLKFRKKPGIEFGPGQSGHKIPRPTEPESRPPRHHRKRQRRRDHRPRNPTLDKTGGLPPLRAEGDLPKY